MKRAAPDQPVAGGPAGLGVARRRLSLGLGRTAQAPDDEILDTAGADDRRLLLEFQSDPLSPNPPHRAFCAVAVGELDVDLLADPRLDFGLDHRAACGDVDHRHLVLAAAEDDDRSVQYVAMALFAPLVRKSRFLSLHRDGRQAAEACRHLFRLFRGDGSGRVDPFA
jgi:hypothetical protein